MHQKAKNAFEKLFASSTQTGKVSFLLQGL